MSHCEFPKQNLPDKEIKELLANSKVIAVVGISNNPAKASYGVAKYLIDAGYSVIPVNPNYDEVLGLKCYSDLKSVPEKIDIVDIFRKPEFLAEVMDEADEIKAKSIWLQLGLCNNEAVEKAKKAGLKVVMNKCIKIEHMKL